MATIVKARGAECTPVFAPVYDAPLDALYSDIATYPIVNKEKKTESTSILSELEGAERLTDVCGWKVRMITKVNGKQYEDVVEIYGEKNRVYNVKIGDGIYSILKTVVRFSNNIKPIE